MTATHQEHIVSCGDGDRISDHVALDTEVTPERWDEFAVPAELLRENIDSRQQARREALDRLQISALSDETVRDFLVLLGVDDQ
jgi:hypothetical protein